MKRTVEEQISYLKSRKLTVIDKVYRIKIEASLGCNRDCKFCGMTRKKSYLLKPKLFEIILAKIPDTVKRIEFILHGEPTLNPNLIDYIEAIRDKHPEVQIAVCSNGFRFLSKMYNPDYLFSLYDKGVNLLQVDLYDIEDWESFKKLMVETKSGREERGIKVKNLYAQNTALFFSYRGDKNRELVYVKEFEGLNSGLCKQRRFHTFGGNVPVELWKNYAIKYLNFDKFPLTGKGKTCTSLLKYVSIGANGDLYFCCRDASHTLLLGNIKDIDLQEWWASEDIQKLRRLMKWARRDLLAQCFLCSRFNYRDGLYPYWGKSYSLEECIQTVVKKTILLDDVLLHNLIKYQEVYPDKIPDHIIKQIEDSKKKYNL